jgi:lysophospholipase L1-like esterase
MWAPTRRQVLAGSVVGAIGGAVLLDSPRVTSRPGFLALGDSYTVGTGVSAEDRWPNDLVERMREERVELASPILVAEDGWTTDHLERAIGERSLDGSYALVTLLIGANDAFRGRPFEIFRPKFVELLTLSLEFAAEPSSVVVMTVPDYTRTPVGQRYSPEEHQARLERYNDAIRAEVAATDARLVDLVPPSRAVDERPELVADDGLHPSPAQHDLWLERILPAARAAVA